MPRRASNPAIGGPDRRRQPRGESTHPPATPAVALGLSDLSDDALSPEVQAAIVKLAGERDRLREDLAKARNRIASLERLADEDALTPVANRRAFVRQLTRMIAFTHRYGVPAAVVYFDVNNMKQINDEHGHPAGDALLQEIAARLGMHLRGNDTVARLGGDEFALILEDIEDPQLALQLCQKLCVALGEPYMLRVNGNSIEVRVGASIGIASYLPGERPDADEQLVHAADRAMYEAKRGGKNRCVLAR